jgi:threonine/homoserine/homoserine lactone efflux protein
VWGVVIGLGVAMALQPLPPLASIVLLSVQRGIRKASAFFLGEFVVMFVIGAVTVALQVGTSRHSASRAASFVTLVAGIVLLLLGAWFAVRSRGAEEVEEPSWLSRLDRMEPWPAFLLGMFLPTYLIAVAAGAQIVGTHPGTAPAVAALLVFLAIGTSTVYTPIVLALVAPGRSSPARARLRDWLVRNWRGVGGVLLLAVGAFLVGKAVVALA